MKNTQNTHTNKSYWLVKSEPSTYAWEDMCNNIVTFWDGVRNYQACNFLKKMQIGDLSFFYHSVKGKEIVGIVEVVKEYYPDHTDPTGKFVMVDFKIVQSLENPVKLEQIKKNDLLNDMPLVKQSRLSVMPITPVQWDMILELSHR